MRSFWNLISTLLFVHLIALIVLFGWLGTSGRLDQDRVKQVVAIFRPTIEEAAQAALAAEAKVQEERDAQIELARLEQVARGPTTVAERLTADQEANEVSLQKIAWLRRSVGNLTARLANDKAQIQKLKADLDKARSDFERAAASRMEQIQDADFQVAVGMYEQLKPKQAKAMFQELLGQGKRQQVIDYLASMKLRKAAAVLREFKEGEDVVQATDLLQGLRERGIEPITRSPDAGSGDAT